MSTTNFEQSQIALTATQAKAQQDRVNADAWGAILNRYPLRDSQANYSVILDWCGDQITVEKFERLWAENPSVLDVSSREEIIQDIVDNSFGNSNDLRSLAFRLSTFSLAQLREKRRTIAFKAEVKSKEQAREVLKNAQPNRDRFPGYVPLPDRLYDSATRTWVTVDKEYLDGLIRNGDLFQFKRLVKLHGPWVDLRRGVIQ